MVPIIYYKVVNEDYVCSEGVRWFYRIIYRHTTTTFPLNVEIAVLTMIWLFSESQLK